jgi:hypothetical protein
MARYAPVLFRRSNRDLMGKQLLCKMLIHPTAVVYRLPKSNHLRGSTSRGAKTYPLAWTFARTGTNINQFVGAETQQLHTDENHKSGLEWRELHMQ